MSLAKAYFSQEGLWWESKAGQQGKQEVSIERPGLQGSITRVYDKQCSWS